MHAYSGWMEESETSNLGGIKKDKKEDSGKDETRQEVRMREKSEVHVRAVSRAPRVVPPAHGHDGRVLGLLSRRRREFVAVLNILAVILLLLRLGVMTMLLGVIIVLRVMTMLWTMITVRVVLVVLLLGVMTMLLGTMGLRGVVVVMLSRLRLRRRRRMRMNGDLEWQAGWLRHGLVRGRGAAGCWA